MNMQKIVLKSLSLTNFKGARSQEIVFSEQGTVISGENGTGKTTIFDAFLWLLFGKDSSGRSDSNFNIKTLDPQTGKPILHLEHSVCAVLDVNGREIKLQRNYVENWVKPRGTMEETLKDHKTECYINDVKVGTKKEYDAEINALIPEDVFKMITNPYYFNSLRPETQKDMLLEMAGNITDAEVAALNPEYVKLLEQLSGRPLAQYAKEVAAKKKACKDALAVIPSQIDTANRLRPASEDWGALEKELAEKKEKLADIDAQISDKSKLNEQEYQRKAEVQKQIGDKRIALVNAENTIRSNASADARKAAMELKDLEYKLQRQQNDIVRKKESISSIKRDVDSLVASMNALRADFHKIRAEVITYPDGAFVCPTCKRPLEVEDIEAKQAELQANFNQEKASKLKANQEKGKAFSAKKDEYQKKLSAYEQELKDLESQVETTQKLIETKKAAIPEEQDADALIATDRNCINLRNEITELENQLKMEAKPVDVSELQSGKRVLSEAITELNKRLANRSQIERVDKEIADLEEKRVANNQELADLERWEFTALEFKKAKDAKLLERINGMFQVVSFNFVSDQLNGGEKLTCVCTVNGTPYPDVNTAGKVNAGLDIINAICSAKGVSAPIFIDNRESVNQIIPTVSQVINLVVSKDKSLTIK